MLQARRKEGQYANFGVLGEAMTGLDSTLREAVADNSQYNDAMLRWV